jgi:hypothetical protein
VVARSVLSTVRWAWQPAIGRDARNRAGIRRAFLTAGASAGVGTLLTVVASLSSGRCRLLWSTGAVVTLSYAAWTIVAVGVTTQFALAVEEASRSQGDHGTIP